MKKVKPDGIFGGRNKVFFDADGKHLIYVQAIQLLQKRREGRKSQKVKRKSYKKMKIKHSGMVRGCWKMLIKIRPMKKKE